MTEIMEKGLIIAFGIILASFLLANIIPIFEIINNPEEIDEKTQFEINVRKFDSIVNNPNIQDNSNISVDFHFLNMTSIRIIQNKNYSNIVLAYNDYSRIIKTYRSLKLEDNKEEINVFGNIRFYFYFNFTRNGLINILISLEEIKYE